MGRLTKRGTYNVDIGIWVKEIGGNETFFATYDEGFKAIEKLAHYEDMEEQGRLIEQSYSYVNTIVGKMGVMHQECSKCNEELEWKAYPNYCPNCGAKMGVE